LPDNFLLSARLGAFQSYRVPILAFASVAVGAYLLGSIPTGFLLAKARGLDIRAVGSGNIGATNVFRALGRTAGSLVLLADAAKGFAACTLLPLVVSSASPARGALTILAGVCAVLGHNYTCWLGFRGGKGIATSAGVLAAWMPLALGLAAAVWLVTFVVSRFVSLASIAAATALPFGVWLTSGNLTLILISVGLSVMAIFKHRSNIQRLLSGTEHRVNFRRAGSPGPR
jgi:glycerol-3-phosphate acyltransferase PlsY